MVFLKKCKKCNSKVIGVVMAAILVASIFAAFAPASIGQPSPPTGGAIYYLAPDNSSVSGGSPGDTTVQLRVNSNAPFDAGAVAITYDSACANITGFTFDSEWEMKTGPTLSPGMCRFAFGNQVGGSPTNLTAGDYLIGTLTIQCESSCCGTNLTFNSSAAPICTPYCMDLTDAPGLIPHISPLATDNGTFICGEPLTVTKKVWDESSTSWINSLGPLPSTWKGKDVRFNITVTAGCLDLSSVVVDDSMDSSLAYNNSANPTEASNTTHTANWNLGSIDAGNSKSIEFNATIVAYGPGDNTANATATVTKLGVEAKASGTASVEAMPPAGLEVNKTVWDPDAQAWVQNITAVVDYVNIGDSASETGHSLNGFGPEEPATHGGGWGGADDGNLRVIWTPIAPDDGGRDANFTLDNPYLNAKLLQLRVLDGAANADSDSFNVYVNGNMVYTYLSDPDTTERWVTHSIDVSTYSSAPTLVVEMNATGDAWSGWATYGQVGVSWAKLYRDSPLIGDTYRFRCEVHNTGSPGMDLTQIEVWDVISPSLEYADTAMIMTPNGVWRSIEPPTSTKYGSYGTMVNWTIDDFLQDPLVLVPCNTFVVEYNVTVIDHGFDCNVQYARGLCEASGGQWVDNSDDACIDTRYPDLTVKEIEVNSDLSGAIGYAFVHNCNNLSAVIKEINGVDVSDTFNVTFKVDGDKKGSVPVNGIGALQSKTVWCNCSWTPDSIGTVTINVTVDADLDVDEESETNNDLEKTQEVIYNGYKGDGWQDGRNITNLQCHEQGPINLTYSTGDSEYVSGYYTKWDHYEVNWEPSNFSIPPTDSCIKKARLYAYYHADRYGDQWSNLSMVFNGVPKTPVANYSDGKGFGSWDYSSNFGVLAYDVANEFMVTSNNIANLTNNNPPGSGSRNKGISMEAMLLVVVYNNTETEPHRIIWINEGCDLLSSKYPKYGVSPEEATTYAQFPICVDPIPMNEVVGAKLITVAQCGGEGVDKNRLFFNDVGEWHGLWPLGYVPHTNIGIHEADVRPYLDSTDNTATYQDNGDMFAVANAFMVVEKGRVQIEVVDPEGCVGVTEQFDVPIRVDPKGIPVYGAEYELTFNSSVIHAEYQIEGDFLKQGGASTNVYINTIDNGAGKVSFAVTRTGTTTGATEPGTLAIIHFTAVATGTTSNLTLTSVKIADPDARPLPKKIIDSTVSVCTNEPPVAVPRCLFTYNNVGTKYMSKTYFDGSDSYDPDGNITNYRWYFGDGNYGAGVTYEHIYGSWNWNGASYNPFEAILTVEDDGVPMMDNSSIIPVNVYIAGDANGDGIVDIFDAVTVGLEWDAVAALGNGIWWYNNLRGDKADLNNDKIVDIFDGATVGANWDHTAY